MTNTLVVGQESIDFAADCIVVPVGVELVGSGISALDRLDVHCAPCSALAIRSHYHVSLLQKGIVVGKVMRRRLVAVH